MVDIIGSMEVIVPYTSTSRDIKTKFTNNVLYRLTINGRPTFVFMRIYPRIRTELIVPTSSSTIYLIPIAPTPGRANYIVNTNVSCAFKNIGTNTEQLTLRDSVPSTGPLST